MDFCPEVTCIKFTKKKLWKKEKKRMLGEWIRTRTLHLNNSRCYCSIPYEYMYVYRTIRVWYVATTVYAYGCTMHRIALAHPTELHNSLPRRPGSRGVGILLWAPPGGAPATGTFIKISKYSIVEYLQHIGESKKFKSSAEEACNAVSWVHSTAGLPPLLSDCFVKATLEGLRCMLTKPVKKKEPVTVEMLKAIVDDAERSGSLSDLRLATACLLSFSGFMRAAEVLELRPCM